jgi:hypothetical protein
VVRHGEDGYLWADTGALQGLTRELIAAPDRRRQLGAAARRRSFGWCPAEFKKKMIGILLPLVRQLAR